MGVEAKNSTGARVFTIRSSEKSQRLQNLPLAASFPDYDFATSKPKVASRARLFAVDEEQIYRNGRITGLLILAYASNVESMDTPKQLSADAIREFKAIYKEEFGKVLSDDEAREMGLRLLNFLKFLLVPIPSPSPARTSSPD
jgi:hypothetical protein